MSRDTTGATLEQILDSDAEDKLYSIGEVSKICNVSKKALRFYDKIGLIAPDYISSENNYRYYSRETLLFVPVIKYYKQMGFKLEEMKILMESNRFDFHAKKLRDKIDELRRMREEINIAYTSVNDWYNLIREAEGVLENHVTEVSVKYIEPITACYRSQDFNDNYMDAIINIDWTNYLETLGHEITGAVHLYFPHFREKLAGKPTKAVIFQKGIGPIDAHLWRQDDARRISHRSSREHRRHLSAHRRMGRCTWLPPRRRRHRALRHRLLDHQTQRGFCHGDPH